MNDSRKLDIELQELLAELLDGSLDQDTRQRLNERLSQDPVAQKTYLDFCEAHAALAWEHGLVVADIAPSTQAPTRSARSGRSWTRVAAIVAAIAASLIFALVWFSSDYGSSLYEGRLSLRERSGLTNLRGAKDDQQTSITKSSNS